MGFDGVMSTNDHDEYLSNLQATADRRLELLREIERDFSAVCMFCRGRLKSMGLGFEVTGHADDCRLAKELSDG